MNKTIVYAATVDVLCDAAVYENALLSMSSYRRDKIVRLRTDEDKRLSLGAELLLRYALAEWGISEYTVAHDENGKPFLVDRPDVCFNLSHSGNAVLCAVSSSAVGCDIQKQLDYHPRVVERCFTPTEQDLLRSLDGELQSTLFTKLWVRKESVAKAIGKGLAVGLNKLDCSSGQNVNVDGVKYTLSECTPFQGYTAAVCTVSSNDSEWRTVELLK